MKPVKLDVERKEDRYELTYSSIYGDKEILLETYINDDLIDKADFGNILKMVHMTSEEALRKENSED